MKEKKPLLKLFQASIIFIPKPDKDHIRKDNFKYYS